MKSYLCVMECIFSPKLGYMLVGLLCDGILTQFTAIFNKYIKQHHNASNKSRHCTNDMTFITTLDTSWSSLTCIITATVAVFGWINSSGNINDRSCNRWHVGRNLPNRREPLQDARKKNDKETHKSMLR